MREIKFRAWDKIHKEMSTWPSLYDNPNLWEYILSHNEQFENWIGDIVLMQFTGLYDKNGKEIYEGDVVRCYGGAYLNGIYEYDYVIEVRDIRDLNGIVHSENVEILGNKYENPELLEENQ